MKRFSRVSVYERLSRGVSVRNLVARGQQRILNTDPRNISTRNDVTVNGSKRVTNRQQRRYFDFQNESDTAMRLNFGFPATANVGINIAVGAFRSWNVADDIGVVLDDIHVFCTVAGKAYSYSEAGA